MRSIRTFRNKDGTYTVNGPDGIGAETFQTYAEAATRQEERMLKLLNPPQRDASLADDD